MGAARVVVARVGAMELLRCNQGNGEAAEKVVVLVGEEMKVLEEMQAALMAAAQAAVTVTATVAAAQAARMAMGREVGLVEVKRVGLAAARADSVVAVACMLDSTR